MGKTSIMEGHTELQMPPQTLIMEGWMVLLPKPKEAKEEAIAKHLALLAEAGLVTAEPGERRRVRYRLRSAPMQVAQQFLAALARDWDGPLSALQDHLDQSAGGPSTAA